MYFCRGRRQCSKMHPVVWVAVYTVCNFGGRLGCSRRVGDAEGLLESCEGTCTDQARRGWQNAFQVLKVGGKLPRLNKEWKMLKGRHDGGTGDGLPLGRVALFNELWAKYHFK